MATLCLSTTYGPGPGELPGNWGSMVFGHAPISRKGSGSQQQQQQNHFQAHKQNDFPTHKHLNNIIFNDTNKQTKSFSIPPANKQNHFQTHKQYHFQPTNKQYQF